MSPVYLSDGRELKEGELWSILPDDHKRVLKYLLADLIAESYMLQRKKKVLRKKLINILNQKLRMDLRKQGWF